jgi:hypothetical protein
MATDSLEIINAGFLKLGGAGGQIGNTPFLANLDGNDDLTLRAIEVYDRVRKRVITELAVKKSPFKETLKYADLGDDLVEDDLDITSITVGASPFPVTVVTSTAHGLTTEDTRYLTGIRGSGGISVLNNTLETVTVVDTTSFTLTATGAAAWSHTEGTGKVSKVPEIGDYIYAFDLPSDCLVVVRQLDEAFSSTAKRQEYRFDTMLNRAGDSKILVTNNLCSSEGDSAFIEYCIDQETTTTFSLVLEECIICLFAAEICPIVGKDLQTRTALMQEYLQLAIPNALAYNGSQSNNIAKRVLSYTHSRSNGR